MPNSSIKDGDFFDTKYGKVEVLKYNNANNILIKFTDTGFVTKTRSGNLQKGSVKDKLRPTVYGVGFLGTCDKVDFKIYKLWQSMLCRCYSSKYHKLKPTYIDCEVCDEWKDYTKFQEEIQKVKGFKEWYEGEGLQLDKDHLSGKLYSLKTCLFLSAKDNAYIRK